MRSMPSNSDYFTRRNLPLKLMSHHVAQSHSLRARAPSPAAAHPGMATYRPREGATHAWPQGWKSGSLPHRPHQQRWKGRNAAPRLIPSLHRAPRARPSGCWAIQTSNVPLLSDYWLEKTPGHMSHQREIMPYPPARFQAAGRQRQWALVESAVRTAPATKRQIQTQSQGTRVSVESRRRRDHALVDVKAPVGSRSDFQAFPGQL